MSNRANLARIMSSGRVTLAALILFCAGPAQATSILAISFEQLVGSSELAFEGRVLARRVVADGPADMVHTHVTFQLVQVLKGRYTGSTIVLSFMGGTIGGVTTGIAGVTPPEAGEHGIYFIESLTRRMMDPRYGIDQGHFLIRQDAATRTERVYSRSMQAIVGFVPNAKPSGMSNGIAWGLVTAEVPRFDRVMTTSAFAQLVRDIARQ